MYMNFLMFLDRLAKASEQAAEERGSSRVREPDVNKYLQVSATDMYKVLYFNKY